MGKTGSEAVSATAPMAAIAEGSLQESSQPEAPLAEIAVVSTPDFAYRPQGGSDLRRNSG